MYTFSSFNNIFLSILELLVTEFNFALCCAWNHILWLWYTQCYFFFFEVLYGNDFQIYQKFWSVGVQIYTTPVLESMKSQKFRVFLCKMWFLPCCLYKLFAFEVLWEILFFLLYILVLPVYSTLNGAHCPTYTYRTSQLPSLIPSSNCGSSF